MSEETLKAKNQKETNVERVLRLGITDPEKLKSATMLDKYDRVMGSAKPAHIHLAPNNLQRGFWMSGLIALPAMTDDAPRPRPPTDGEREAAVREVEALIRDKVRADAVYDALPGSYGGRFIDTEVALDLYEPHRGGPWQAFDWFATIYPLAREYARDRVLREVGQAGDGRRLVMSAGGEAAGKSTMLRKLPDEGVLRPEDRIYDDTLRDLEFAKRAIQTALEHGWEVHVLYVHRRIEDALEAILPRANETGWYWKFSDVGRSHREAQASCKEVYRLYENDPRVSFCFFSIPCQGEEIPEFMRAKYPEELLRAVADEEWIKEAEERKRLKGRNGEETLNQKGESI